MKTYSESLYWTDFLEYFHDDPKTGKIVVDPDAPERVIKSFREWEKKNNDF